LLTSAGHAHHIVLFIGYANNIPPIVEAKGRAWGVIQSSIANLESRGVIWMRRPGIDLGELSTKQEVEDMTKQEYDELMSREAYNMTRNLAVLGEARATRLILQNKPEEAAKELARINGQVTKERKAMGLE
jgi:hypothetical protein